LYEQFGRPSASRRREEEHVATFDELAILRRDERVIRHLLQPVRQPLGVELPLQLAVSFLVEA
jgi:hypothetical protein